MIVIHRLYAPSLSSLTDKAHIWQYYIAFFSGKLNSTASIDGNERQHVGKKQSAQSV
jgi:hypothetical protein